MSSFFFYKDQIIWIVTDVLIKILHLETISTKLCQYEPFLASVAAIQDRPCLPPFVRALFFVIYTSRSIILIIIIKYALFTS